jgi:hypothetical protein
MSNDDVNKIKSIIIKFEKIKEEGIVFWNELKNKKDIDIIELSKISQFILEFRKLKNEIKDSKDEKLKKMSEELDSFSYMAEEAMNNRHFDKLLDILKKEFIVLTEEEKNLIKNIKNNQLNFKSGDIIGFSLVGSDPTLAIIKIASHSLYDPAGILEVDEEGKVWLIHTSDGVSRVELKEFIDKGNNKFSIYRVKHLSDKDAKKIIEVCKSWLGRKYDYGLTPGRDEFYCSELVYEAYKEIGIDFGRDLSLNLMKERLIDYMKRKYNKTSEETTKNFINLIIGPTGFYNKLDGSKIDWNEKFITSPEIVLRNKRTIPIYSSF